MRNIKRLSCLLSLSLVILASCNTQPAQKLTLSGLDPAKFVDTIKGKATALYTLKNKNGMEVCITNFGGRVVSIMAPDKNGKFQDVVLGFDNIKQYADTKNTPSDYGASIGRYANRIKDGKITIDNKTIQLPKNNFGHCLHGGPEGWQYQVYQAKQIDAQTLKLTMDSPDGDANFPGHVIAIVTYKLLDNNALDIAYEATTDKKTVINMTNHSYFVLGGDPDSLSLDNILYVNADNYTPVDSTYMTTGEIAPVAGTPFDFRTPKTIGQDINANNIQIKNGNGYDHNWVLNTYKNGKGDLSQVAVRLVSPKSGISLEVYTNEPGIQVYTGNFQDGTYTGKKGKVYQKRVSVCLETQKYPDTPNKPNWPSCTLAPGEKYESHCIFKFGITK